MSNVQYQAMNWFFDTHSEFNVRAPLRFGMLRDSVRCVSSIIRCNKHGFKSSQNQFKILITFSRKICLRSCFGHCFLGGRKTAWLKINCKMVLLPLLLLLLLVLLVLLQMYINIWQSYSFAENCFRNLQADNCIEFDWPKQKSDSNRKSRS